MEYDSYWKSRLVPKYPVEGFIVKLFFIGDKSHANLAPISPQLEIIILREALESIVTGPNGTWKGYFSINRESDTINCVNYVLNGVNYVMNGVNYVKNIIFVFQKR